MIALRQGLSDIYACGLRLRTVLPLPAALDWPNPEPGEPDAVFVAGEVGGELVDPAAGRDVIQFGAHGTALLRLEGIGHFLIRARQVTCDFEVPPDAPVLASIVFGNIAACLSWRRHRLALHGSAVAIDGRALVLPGGLGAGKSVLAAALVRRGHVLLADEVAVISDGMCFPAGGTLQLADDALAAAVIDADGLPVYDHFRIPKRHWIAGPPPQARAYPVAAIICLARARPAAPIDLLRLRGKAAEAAILKQFYWPEMLEVLDSRAWAATEAAATAERVPIFDLAVPRSLDRVEEVADHLERAALGSAGASG